ncbi:MAG: leucine-rich repeat protein [Clostridiales bacterium]|nr:leucine-rich repeat protein [Clostridiales bacterium]
MNKKIAALLLTTAMTVTAFPTNVFAQNSVMARKVESTYDTVKNLMENVNFGSASCFGTAACFGSVYFRVLRDDHNYYKGARTIENYLKNTFIEEDGTVSVNPSSQLRSISYTDALTVINFASAFSSYEEYVLRNNLTLSDELAEQKELAIQYFETVNDKAEGYHTHSSSGAYTYPSMAVATVAMGSLMGQSDTDRFDQLIRDAYDHLDANFWNSGMYLDPFYQLCAKYDWYETPAVQDESLTDSAVLKYYAYGIDLEEEYPDLWDAYVETALEDDALSTAEAKAFAYHYAYQFTDGDVNLGIYGDSRDIVDFDINFGEVEALEDAIESIPAIADLTVEDAETVQMAKEKYDGLSEQLKALVSEKKLETLKTAEARIKELENPQEPEEKPQEPSDDDKTENNGSSTNIPQQNPSEDKKTENNGTSINTPQTNKPVETVGVGSIISDSATKADYKVTKKGDSGNTVEYLGSSVKKGAVIIPATVTLRGTMYKVTSIGKKAFAGNKTLKKVVIGKNIRSIKSKAFYNCKKLKNIKIKTTKLTKKSVGTKAFKGINKKAKVNVPNKKLVSYRKILLNRGVKKQTVIK